MVYIVKGTMMNKVDDGKETLLRAGDSFTEQPNAHHVVFKNPSKTETAIVYAIFFKPKSQQDITILDKK